MDFILALIVGLLILVCLYFLFRKGRQKGVKTSGDSSSTKDTATLPVEEQGTFQEQLILLTTRTAVGGVSEKVRQRLDAVIDGLLELIPKMRDQYAGSELTWQVERMAEHHLPLLIDTFIALGETERSAGKSDLIAAIAAMDTEINEISGLVSRQEVNAFERKAEALQKKYGEGTLT